MSLSYVQKDTGIQNSNPFVKLALLISFIVMGSLYDDPIYLIVFTI